MFADLSFIFIWWLIFFLIGTLSLPIIFYFFDRFWDHGYVFSKTLSLVTITYFILVFGIFKILPFTLLGLSFVFLGFFIFDIFFLINKKRYQWFLEVIKSKYKIFLIEELIFLIVFISWSFIRGFAPSIEGLEKYMDWGFVNSALRSKYLPPQDMWFSGEVINYYYFGHLMFALITKISQVPSEIAYNLSISIICALTFVNTFCLSSNLVYLSLKKKSLYKYLIAGLISAFLLTFGGNFHSIYKIAKLNYSKNNNQFVWNKAAINQAITAYWYPDATRFIGHDPDTNDKTIHEFPIYSFVVSDLHGHMNDIIIVTFFMAFLLASFIDEKHKFNWRYIIFSGFILSLCYMTNAWDFAVYGLLLAIFTIFINFYRHNIQGLLTTIFSGLLIILFWYLFSLPFSLKFIPMMEGIKISDGHTPLYQLFILYGGFWVISLPFIFYLIIQFFKKLKNNNSKFKLLPSDIFVVSLILTASILILIPELVYIKDIYIYEHRRANTMFKLVYQAFMMYSLVSGYTLIRLVEVLKSRFLIFLYKIFFTLVFLVHMIYPYFAIKSYYSEFRYYQGLDGLTYLKDLYPDNYKAILWINKNISGQPVLLEAVGDSYTTYNQVSSATGLPTVQGWVVHEWLWRGGYDSPAARQSDVEKIYTSKDLEETKILINQYQIKYIFVGDKEYEKYPNLDPQRFKDIGAKIVFQSGKTVIYQL